MDFEVAPGPLQQIVLQGLAADTQFQFAGAARPERTTKIRQLSAPDGA